MGVFWIQKRTSSLAIIRIYNGLNLCHRTCFHAGILQSTRISCLDVYSYVCFGYKAFTEDKDWNVYFCLCALGVYVYCSICCARVILHFGSERVSKFLRVA